MTQSDFGTIDPATKSGPVLAADLNAFRDALESAHKGSARPSYARAGTVWIKEVSSSNWPLYLYDGTSDIQFGTFNPSAHTFSLSFSGTIAGSRVAGGLGSGLDGDTIQGQDLSKLVRKDTSSDIAAGVTLRFKYSYSLNADDGKIGARLAAPGLNIYGIATENDGVRRVTSWGTWVNNGPFSTVGGFIAAGTYIAAASGYAAYASQFRFLEGGNDTGFDWASEGAVYFVSNNAGKVLFNSDGTLWTATYGWLHQAFASASPAAGQGDTRQTGVCASSYPIPAQIGWELYKASDTSTGAVLQARYFTINCSECGACDNCGNC